MSAATESALYIGTVSHVRSRPKRNEFSYGIYFLYVDVDRLDELAQAVPGLGHSGGPGRVRVYDVDHGPRDGSSLRSWIDALLTQAGVDLGPDGRVMLLTFPRIGRWKFYPASFWYCFDGDDAPRAVLAEVQNTYGEHHNYLLHTPDGGPMRWDARPEATKVFHVSPFIEMDARYTFTFTEPGETLGIRILDTVQGEPLLFAKIDLERRPLAAEALDAVVQRYGPMSRRAASLIGWQALRLLGKGIKFLPHPPVPQEETSL